MAPPFSQMATTMSTPHRILIAEDNRAMLNVLKFNLERAGYEVLTAATGEEAARLIESNEIALVFTDIQMPGMSGEELCDHIRNKLGLADLKIVICSAKAMEVDSARLVVEYRLEHVVCKPFSPQAIVDLAQSILKSACIA